MVQKISSGISCVWEDDILIVIINIILTRKHLTNNFYKPYCIV